MTYLTRQTKARRCCCPFCDTNLDLLKWCSDVDESGLLSKGTFLSVVIFDYVERYFLRAAPFEGASCMASFSKRVNNTSSYVMFSTTLFIGAESR